MRPDVMGLLGAADPVDPAEVRGWAQGEEGRRVFFQVVAANGLRARPPLPRRRRFALLPVGAAALTLALVVGSLLLPDGRGGASAEAAEVLRSAAKAAGAQSPVASEGRYRYTRSENAYLSTSVDEGQSVTALVPQVRELWVASDASGRIREKVGEPVFLGPRDRASWEALGSPDWWGAGTSDQAFGPGELYYEDFSGLSTDPDELYGQIARRAGEPETSGELPVPQNSPQAVKMFAIVGDLLRETLAPPEVRAALYEVAARIPGVELVGEVKDSAGRTGVAVARNEEGDGVRLELVFDPETSELLAERQVLLRRVRWVDAAPGTAIGWATYLESGTVDSTSDRPS
jgi:hypothetical protein